MRTRQTLIEEYFELQKQMKIKSDIEEDSSVLLFVQPILAKHANCNDSCLEFKRTFPNIQWIQIKHKIQQQVDLFESYKWIQSQILIKEREQVRCLLKKNSIKKTKQLCKRAKILTQQQREQIREYKQNGFSNGFICGQMQITVNQVKGNQKILSKLQVRKEIYLTNLQKEWLLNQAQESSNPSLFNSKIFYQQFSFKFPQHSFSISQFRQKLHELNIKFLVPQLKPLSFFVKPERNDQVKFFIQQIVSYKQAKFKILFIDECSIGNISKHSHKQWHLKGSFKQNIHRIQSFISMIGCIGEDDFLRYQLIKGTGKAVIFHMFVTQIIQSALIHYQSEKIVLVFDNAATHTAGSLRELLKNIPHIYTPPYRPEFNAIEHMFSWLKRRIVQNQPMISSQFLYQIHSVFNELPSFLINRWCQSILKPMLLELDYLVK